MADKTTTLEEAVAHVRDGMTVGIGGCGLELRSMTKERTALYRDVFVIDRTAPVVTIGPPFAGSGLIRISGHA